jgi:hypothetical protein
MVSSGQSAAPSFAAWAGNVTALCDAVDRLAPVAASLGVADASAAAWHGALFGKLRPQVSREPLLVAAVCGGTNTGKSIVANTLVGTEISRSVPEAARTRHPVASLPAGLAGRIDLAALFPGFAPAAWSSVQDAIDLGPGWDQATWAAGPCGCAGDSPPCTETTGSVPPIRSRTWRPTTTGKLPA